MSDLNSSSLIQGGRPNKGLPDASRGARSGGGPSGGAAPEPLVASLEFVPRGLFLHHPKGGGTRRSLLVPPVSSRRGITMIGRLPSPTWTTFVPKSTGLTKVTLRSSQRSTLWGVPLVSKSTGAPAEATISPV